MASPDVKSAPRTVTGVELQHLNVAQREAVTHEGGPLLVIAGAGTGKTTVITERIAWLIRVKGYRPDSILALTFTEKAAAEMEERLDRLLPLGFSRVLIATFHGFCERILRESALEIGLDPAFRVFSTPEQWLLLRRHVFALPLQQLRPMGNPTKFLRALLSVIGKAKDQDLPPEKFDEYAASCEAQAERETETFTRDAQREEATRWREIAAAYRAYNAMLRKESALDFGDLILHALKLFRERTNILKKTRERFRAILVDEFQDTNGAQNELLRLLVPDAAGDITVVGDDDQAIYAWRGSNITNILGFRQTFPGTRNIVLTDNYRSPQDILDAAYALIQRNNPLRLEHSVGVIKKLSSAREIPAGGLARRTGGETVHLAHRHFPTGEQESAFVAETILQLVDSGKRAYHDVAILTRTNAQADDVVPSLAQRDIPYHVAEARGLLLRPEIRDVSAYLRTVDDPQNSMALFRLLSLPIFALEPFERQRLLAETKRSAQYLIETLRSAKSLTFLSPPSVQGIRKIMALLEHDVTRASTARPAQIVLEFLQKSGYLARLIKRQPLEPEAIPNLTEFINFLKEYERSDPEGSLHACVEFLDLVVASGESPPQATLPPDVDAVRIMTVHGAKGLEFPVVFVPGATLDKYPVRNWSEPLDLPETFAPQGDVDHRDAHIAEERRLFYVAMTRARDALFITTAERYRSRKTRHKSSPFIAEAGIRTLPSRSDLSPVQQLSLPLAKTSPPSSPVTSLALPATLSVSQVKAYEVCPLQYQFRYVYRVPVPPHYTLTFGNTVHAVLRDLARRVLDGRKPTADDALRLYEQHWSSEGFESKRHESLRKEQGRVMLKSYLEAHENILSRAPLFIEEPFRFRVGEITITGRIDRVDGPQDGGATVTDFKTGSTASQKDADADLQLSVYALALQDVFHLHADRLTLSFLEGNVDRHTTRTDDDLEKAGERLERAAARIRERAFAPTPGYQACRFCAFRAICDFSAV